MEIDNEEFISCILSKPAIWDSRNIHHKNKKIINKCWEEIKCHFGNIEISILKKRWKNLKNQYRKELKKLPVPRSGDAAVNVQSTWQYFSQMNFLRYEVLPEESDTNLNNVEVQCSNALMSTASSSTEINDELATTETAAVNPRSPIDAVNILQPAIDNDDNINIEASTNSPLSINTTPSSRPQKRKSANDIRMEMLELEKKRLLLLEKDLQQNSNATQPVENKSEDYHYLMSLLPQMESFGPLQRYHVRNRINQIMMEEIQNSMYGDPYRGTSSSNSWPHGYSTRGPPE